MIIKIVFSAQDWFLKNTSQLVQEFKKLCGVPGPTEWANGIQNAKQQALESNWGYPYKITFSKNKASGLYK